MESLIALRGAGKTFETRNGPVVALTGVDLEVGLGEFVSLLGPSGCGKSTLLRLVSGLERATSGEVAVSGRTVHEPPDDIGMVFQKAVLLDWNTIEANVLVPARMKGLPVARYRDRARELLSTVGLDGFADRYPRELSGGMQQRVALCRALLLDPPVLLMDEPFGALDAMTRDEMNLELARIFEAATQSDRPKTVLFVTHSIPEAVLLSDRICVMTPRPGKVADVVPVDLPRPRSVATRGEPGFGRLSTSLYEALDVRVAHGQLRD